MTSSTLSPSKLHALYQKPLWLIPSTTPLGGLYRKILSDDLKNTLTQLSPRSGLLAEDESASQPSGRQCEWPGRRWVRHVSEEEFAVMQLAGVLLQWDISGPDGLKPIPGKWWTQVWDTGGHFVCCCGSQENT